MHIDICSSFKPSTTPCLVIRMRKSLTNLCKINSLCRALGLASESVLALAEQLRAVAGTSQIGLDRPQLKTKWGLK